MDLSKATDFLATNKRGTIITLGEGEVPHATIVAYAVIPTDDGPPGIGVSITDERVKTGNLRRRPLAVLHVHSDDMWTYASVVCDAELSPVSAAPGDDIGRELLEVYETVSGPHPDPDEFFQAMVDDKRLVLRLTPTSAHGQVG